MASNNYASYYVSPSAVQYNNYLMAQTVGPLSTSQTPGQILYHKKGVLEGVHPNPPHYYPMDTSSEFAQARYQFWRTETSKKQQMLAREKVLAENPRSQYYSADTNRNYLTTGHMNYIPPPDSSLYIRSLKSRAIGKSSYKIGLPPSAPMTNKVYDKNDVKTILGRVRRAGCCAPAKKGALENRNCTVGGGICNLGALSGQGY